LSNEYLHVFYRKAVVIKPAYGVVFLPHSNYWVGNGILTTYNGSGGSATEDLTGDLPLEFFGKCYMHSHKTRPPYGRLVSNYNLFGVK
jgi:hypothetical protein